MPYISSDKNIRDFVLNLLRSGQWEIIRRSKHTVIRHIAEGANKNFTIPCTPSDIKAYANFRKDYYRYLREFLIYSGWIQRCVAA